MEYINGQSFAVLNFYSVHMYVDFPSNTFVVQGQGAYMLYLEQKIHGENFCVLLKPQKPQKFGPVKLTPFTVVHDIVDKLLYIYL